MIRYVFVLDRSQFLPHPPHCLPYTTALVGGWPINGVDPPVVRTLLYTHDAVSRSSCLVHGPAL